MQKIIINQKYYGAIKLANTPETARVFFKSQERPAFPSL